MDHFIAIGNYQPKQNPNKPKNVQIRGERKKKFEFVTIYIEIFGNLQSGLERRQICQFVERYKKIQICNNLYHFIPIYANLYLYDFFAHFLSSYIDWKPKIMSTFKIEKFDFFQSRTKIANTEDVQHFFKFPKFVK